jgi:uncharacterized OB-fold protein
VFFFIKGYFWGASSVKSDKQLSEKREEMYGKINELKCYKCFHVINPEENKCPNCGWTWERQEKYNRHGVKPALDSPYKTKAVRP